MSSHTIKRHKERGPQHDLASRYRDIGIKSVAAAVRNKPKEANVSNNNEERGLKEQSAKEDDHG